jgi:NADH-quinone oxidoreductase subunit L
LFLSAGAVIHALHKAQHITHEAFDAQDMRNMGGLKHKLPLTFFAYLFCMLALAGLPVFSGFISKDAILTQALAWAEVSRSQWGILVWLVPLSGFVTAVMTAIYMGRQLFFVFFGITKVPAATFNQLKDVNWRMRVPLTILAVLSLALPFSYTLVSSEQAWLLNSWSAAAPALPGSGQNYGVANWLFSIRETAGYFHSFTAWVSVGLSVVGLLLAYFIYHLFNGRGEFYTIHFNFKQRYCRLSHNNWYLDALYETTFIRMGRWLSLLAKWIDKRILDWLINTFGASTVILSHVLAWADRWLVDGIVNLGVWTVGQSGNIVRGVQSGQIQRYLIILAGAVILLLLWWVI